MDPLSPNDLGAYVLIFFLDLFTQNSLYSST